MESEEGIEQNKVSKYNSAIAQLQRLDNLWLDCHRHSRSGNYAAWNSDLDKIWCELASDTKENGTEEKKFNDFVKKIASYGRLSQPVNVGFSVPTQLDMIRKAKQYMVLLEKEIWLRRLQNSQGKGTKYDDDDEDMID